MESNKRDLQTILGKAQRQAARSRKHLWQRMNLDRNGPKTPLFVVGNQRSGTTMLMKVLEKSRYMRVYQEHSRKAFGTNWRLLPPETIHSLIDNSYAPVVVFKPLTDSHLTDQLLTEYKNSKAIWIYRTYVDVANSAVNKWGEHLKDVMHQITVGDWEKLGWRGERLSEENIALVKQLYSPQMTFQEAAALMWYLRNQWYYQLNLVDDPRVLLVRYENLVAEPKAGVVRIFDWLGAQFEPEIVEDVSERSVGKGKHLVMSPAVQQVCDDLLNKLNATYQEKVGAAQ
jgi:hypothetical protein